MSTHYPKKPSDQASLSELLRQLAPRILADWEQAVRQLPVARSLPRPVLLDHVPQLLERIAKMADDMDAGREPRPLEGAAEWHAHERLEAGFDLNEVVAEFAALRTTITHHIWEVGVLPARQHALTVFNRAIDAAVAASVHHFTRQSRRTLEALDRISTASLESRNLDELLRRLLQVFLRTTVAVDTAVVLLREGDLLRVRAAAGLEEEGSNGFSLKMGEGFAGTIAASRQPMALAHAAADPLVKSALIHAKGVRALYGVPLVASGDVIGVLHMGSLTTPEFSEQDTHLFNALAARATSAIFQHMLQEKLESERARLAAIIEELPAGIAIAEAPSGRFLMGNRELATIWRRPITKFDNIDQYGEEWPAFHVRDGRRLEPDEWALARAVKGEKVRQEVMILRGDGTYGFVLNTAAPIRDAEGRVLAAVVANVDITEHKHAEAERERLLVEVDFERNRYLELLNHLDHAVVWEADPGTLEFTFVSSRAEPVTGFSPEEWRSPNFWASHVPPDDYRSLFAMFEKCRSIGYQGHCDHRFIRRDGQTIWLRTGVHILRKGNPGDKLVGVSLDITELQVALRAREEILAIVSHDLRNPLASIVNAAALIDLHAAKDDTLSRFRRPAEVITRSAKNMVRMIADLMDITSIETGRLSVTPKPEDPARIVSDVAAEFQERARQNGLSLECNVAAGLPLVSCDRDRMTQVFANLITNSIQVMKPGGSIVLRAEAREGDVVFSVSDTGPGIPAHDIPRLFEPRWRGDKAGYKGTGLGLAIVHGIMAAHGGKIWVESEVGRGTTFFLSLPSAQA